MSDDAIDGAGYVKTTPDGQHYLPCGACLGKGFVTDADIASGRIGSNQPLAPGPCPMKCTDGKILLTEVIRH